MGCIVQTAVAAGMCICCLLSNMSSSCQILQCLVIMVSGIIISVGVDSHLDMKYIPPNFSLPPKWTLLPSRHIMFCFLVVYYCWILFLVFVVEQTIHMCFNPAFNIKKQFLCLPKKKTYL